MIYNCFISNNPQMPSIGNPTFIHFYGEGMREEEMKRLAIASKTPMSCFVKIEDNKAYIKFFAPNGQKEGLCIHGLIGVSRGLKDKNLEHITTLITENGITLRGEVLESGASQIQILTEMFEVSSFNDTKVIEQINNIFNLNAEVLEVFKADIGDLVVELNSPEALQNLRFERKDLIKFLSEQKPRVLSFFCNKSNFESTDVEIRVFYINLENLEDIVCGSANISIAKILYKKYGIEGYKVVQPFNYFNTGKIGGYQEISYNPDSKALTIKGLTEKSKEKFIFVPLNIKFSKNLKPVSKTEDYYFLREILTDPEVMKTSTAFAGGLAENEYDLHSLMNALVEQDIKFKKDYGFQKIWNIGLGEYIGVAGLVRSQNPETVEYGMLIKSEYIGRGFGAYLLKSYFEKEKDRNIISSVWEQNYPCIKIVEKYGMSLFNNMIKMYKGKILNVNIYIRYGEVSKQIQNIEQLLITKKSA